MRLLNRIKRIKSFSLTAVATVSITACATSQNPNDPYEVVNRKIFIANMTADHFVLRPIAIGYTYIPEPIRDAISNFYNNLRDFVTLGNDILQLNGSDTMHNTMRIAINSTFGILGLIDVSSSMGLPQTQTSFGDTFKRWGWTSSSYIVMPFFGPTTCRDGIGFIPDLYFNPLFWITTDPWFSWGIFGLNLINKRASVLDQEKLLMSSLDPYATIRDIYLQKNGEYIYPQESGIMESESESLDELIDEENGESSPKTKYTTQSSQIDALIDEENRLQAKSGIVPIGAAAAITTAGIESAAIKSESK
jgi:phospholipid-binding lipoprotein MlaA